MLKETLRRAKAAYHLTADLIYDGRRFFHHSQSGRRVLNPPQLQARLLAKAHSIEKGLSMPAVRPYFGRDALVEVVGRTLEYQERGLDKDHAAYRKALGVLEAYKAFHASQGLELPDDLAALIARIPADSAHDAAGVTETTADQFFSGAEGDFRALASGRRSVRTFAGPAPRSKIEDAVRLAQQSPSVCNRQGGRVHVVDDPDKRNRALEIQGGNRGFGHEISTLLVVTQDVSIFRDAKERSQAYVDGGLFSMSLLYALHHLRVATCPLNWSASRNKDKKLRAVLGIPPWEVIIMLIAAGEVHQDFRFACSPRRSATEIITWIK